MIVVVDDEKDAPVRPPLRMHRIMQLLTAVSVPFWTFVMIYQYQFTALRMMAFLGSVFWTPFLTTAALISSRAFDAMMAKYVEFSEKMDRWNRH